MTRLIVAVLAIASILIGTGGCTSDSEKTLYVYCDILLHPTMEAIAHQFEKVSDYEVKLISDSEDRVFQRMKLSKHADLFVSFIPSFIQETRSFGLCDGGREVCSIMPTLITAPLNPLKIHSMRDFDKPDLRYGLDVRDDAILGMTTARLFEKNGFDWDEVYQAVYQTSEAGETLVESLQSSEIDVAILWEPEARRQTLIEVIPIKPEENIYLPVVAMPLKRSSHLKAATDFEAFMRSSKAQAIWKGYGYKPLQSAKP